MGKMRFYRFRKKSEVILIKIIFIVSSNIFLKIVIRFQICQTINVEK